MINKELIKYLQQFPDDKEARFIIANLKERLYYETVNVMGVTDAEVPVFCIEVGPAHNMDEELVKAVEEDEMQVLPSERPRQIHQIKCDKTFFADAAAGVKSFTLRKNDRNYQVGDILEKQEYDDGNYTGRTLRQEVIYKLEDYAGLQEGYCILGVKNLEMVENQSNQTEDKENEQ